MRLRDVTRRHATLAVVCLCLLAGCAGVRAPVAYDRPAATTDVEYTDTGPTVLLGNRQDRPRLVRVVVRHETVVHDRVYRVHPGETLLAYSPDADSDYAGVVTITVHARFQRAETVQLLTDRERTAVQAMVEPDGGLETGLLVP